MGNRQALLAIVLFVGIFGLSAMGSGDWFSEAGESGPATESCAVPANYLEAFQENVSVLLRLLTYANGGSVQFSDNDIFQNYYGMLQSSRAYYLNEQPDLPDCAQELNAAMVDVLQANMEVLALRQFAEANPDLLRMADRRQDSIEALNQSWQRLGQIEDQLGLRVATQ